VLLAAAAVVAWIAVWILVAVRVIRREDLSVAGKIMWLIAILVFPIVGLLVYFLWDAARPRTT
jgi:phospholipase D-like protein